MSAGSTSGLLELLHRVHAGVSSLQEALQHLHPEKLEPALLQLQQALEDLGQYPGGLQALSQDIDQLPAEQRQQARTVLEQARSTHQANSGLLQLAVQRNAAMQSYVAQESASATYGSDGGVQSGVGGQLLGKY